MEIMSTKRGLRWGLSSLSGKLGALWFLCLAAGLLAWPEAVKTGVRDSLLYCLTVLTPSLFPFMALTAFAVNSGAGDALGRGLSWVSRWVFRLPESAAAAILMAFIGGYPAGAKAVSLLLERGKITERQAGRMLLFCVNPGVAFVVTFLGGGIFGDLRVGWLLFWAVTLSGLLLGLLTGLSTPVPERRQNRESLPPSGAVIRSVTDASRSVLTMCACIVLFSGFTALLRGSGLFQLLCRQLSAGSVFTPMEAASLLSFLLEVTGGAGVAAEFGAGPVLFAFGLGFGGLCVHLQVFSCFPKFPLARWKFFLFRFFHGLLAAAFCWILERTVPFDPTAVNATAETAQSVAAFSGTWAGGLSLLLMCAAFLMIISREEDIEKQKERGYNRKKESAAKG